MIDDNSLLSLNKPASSDNNPLFESNILSDSSSEENLSETSLLSLNPSSSEDGVPALSLNPSDSLMPESSGPRIPSVVIDVVKNPGKTNASLPSMLTTVCSKAIG